MTEESLTMEVIPLELETAAESGSLFSPLESKMTRLTQSAKDAITSESTVQFELLAEEGYDFYAGEFATEFSEALTEEMVDSILEDVVEDAAESAAEETLEEGAGV